MLENKMVNWCGAYNWEKTAKDLGEDDYGNVIDESQECCYYDSVFGWMSEDTFSDYINGYETKYDKIADCDMQDDETGEIITKGERYLALPDGACKVDDALTFSDLCPNAEKESVYAVAC